MIRKIKKLFWYIESLIATKKYPLNQSLTYVGVTGTDGKTTTCFFLYEIAKEHGYNPLLITTVGAKFEDKFIELNIKSSTFIAYSIKTFLSNIKKLKFKKAFKALFLQDKKGYSKNIEKHRTTPLASEIRKTILDYEEKGANFFIIECTSHALDQFRVANIKFDSIGFTNITNEHLDYHGNWENYALTKSRLINLLKEGGSVSLNKDDKKSYKFLKRIIKQTNQNLNLIEYQVDNYDKINPEKFLIEVKESTNLKKVFAKSINKVNKDLKQYQTSIKILGKYNIYNALAAFSIFLGFNSSNPNARAKGISNLVAIKGRMQVINENPKVIIDFAHTPNAMEKVLESIKRNKTKGRLWVIFGCAGERDSYKRPVMGKTAFDYADNILITSEDPRSENLFDINNQIIEGFKYVEDVFTIETYYDGLEYNPNNKFIVRFDEPNKNSRIKAINYAIKNASPYDTILILGKGHETSMNYGGKEYKWSDEEVARKALNKLYKHQSPKY